MTRDLFGDVPESDAVGSVDSFERGQPRYQTADRKQLRLLPQDLDALVAGDHPARCIWNAVGRLDLSRFYEPIGAREHTPGRPPPDPRIMVTLWTFAYSEGVGSARRLDELCVRDDAYRWICGGVQMNYHSLADFRVKHEAALQDLSAQLLAVLMHEGFVTLGRVSQDGLRVRASAGSSSFRRKKTLTKCLKQARQQVEEASREAEEPDSQRGAREKAAAERAAKERAERLERALEQLKQVQAGRKKRNDRVGPKAARDPKQARVSTTDPDARVIKMPDSGFRPGFNVQLAADVGSRVVVGVQVSNSGSDSALMMPMLDELKANLGKKPGEYLVDGGYVNGKAITAATRQGITVYAPPKKKKNGDDPCKPTRHDNKEMKEWRTRMSTPEAKQVYIERGATSESINADLRTLKGLDRMLVRGIRKVKQVAMWVVLAYNLQRWMRLERCMA